VGPRAGLDTCGKSRPTGIRPPDRPSRHLNIFSLVFFLPKIWIFLKELTGVYFQTTHFLSRKKERIPQYFLLQIQSHLIVPLFQARVFPSNMYEYSMPKQICSVQNVLLTLKGICLEEKHFTKRILLSCTTWFFSYKHIVINFEM
jgi:hypothetical protein